MKFLLSLCAVFTATLSFAQSDALPTRAAWRATSSSTELPSLAPKFAIDRDPTTKWGGPFSPGHWVQVDLSRATRLGGVVLHWDLAFAVTYLIQTSIDGTTWQTNFESRDSAGTADYVFFPAVNARYLRVAATPDTADWGVNLFEIEPIAARDQPTVVGVSDTEPSAVWNVGQPHVITKRAGAQRQLDIKFAQPIVLAGLEVYWATARTSAKLEGRDERGWRELARDPEALGATSFLAARTSQRVSELRLTVSTPQGVVPALERLRLLGTARVMTPMKRYEIAASRAYRDLFPNSLHQQQVYWTVVGVPAGKQKSIFDEYGHIEAFRSAPLVQAIWRDRSGHTAAAASAATLQHALREGWMPMPSVTWSPQADLQLRSETFAIERDGQPVTLVRHQLHNTSNRSIEGQLAIVVRPMQLNPPWQNGGLSPIRSIAIEGPNDASTVRVNGRLLLHSLTRVDARGVAPFGEHGETEITKLAAAGTVPNALQAEDRDGLAAALLSYEVQLPAGAKQDVVIAFPLGTERLDATQAQLPEAPAIDRVRLLQGEDAGAAFEHLANEAANEWQRRLGGIGIKLPDASLVNMLRAQAAYMLLNQTGHAMQPGPRNYSRSFIRDGSATAIVLLRMGQAAVARDYLRWYAEHAVHENGLVSPILNDDGSVYRGFGSDLEYDAQGQFIWLVAEIARLDGGAQTVREYADEVKKAMQFMQELRERTLAPGYMSDRPAPERFRGLIAPSISHEGYSTPTHSYWDDYWALKGWHDGAWLAAQWGDRATEAWGREQYEALRQSMADSIRTTMAWRGADFIPTDADAGNPDPTSVSIALDPTGQKDLLPRAALERTFARYLDEVRKRNVPGAVFAYTPYELRNMLTYVHLNQPQHADEMLRSFMRHRRPLDWHVFAEVVQSRLRYAIYLGDMPHTWIGSEYARAIFGMLMREEDDRLMLLPGAPPSWVSADGLAVTELPTAYGKLSMTAKQTDSALRVTLAPGLRAQTRVQVWWPNRQRPTRVVVDGRVVRDFSVDAIELDRPFKELIAEWSRTP